MSFFVMKILSPRIEGKVMIFFISIPEMSKSIVKGIGIGFLSCIGIGIGIAKTISQVLVLVLVLLKIS